MLRFGLSVYLVFATLAGPLLCPCAMPRPFAPAGPSDAAPNAPPGCPCCAGLPDIGVNLPRDGQGPAAPGLPCPCSGHGHRTIALAVQRIQPVAASPADPFGAPQVDAWWPSATARIGVNDPARDRFSTPSLISPSNRLHFLCLLRC